MMMSSYIPWEMVDDILSRLPVKSLLRFRCVSSSWLHLIDSSGFVKSHLSRSIRNNTNLSLIFEDRRYRRLSVDVISLVVNNENDNKNNNIVRSLVPPELHERYNRVCGSCNGLVCLSNVLDSVDNRLVLWNPSTRNFRVLPDSPIKRAHRDEPLCTRTRYGFGYNSVNDDYKVVMIVLLENENYELFHVQAYSLKSNSWHSVDKPPRHFNLVGVDLGNGVLAGGALHWVEAPNNDYSYKNRQIFAFDLGSEKYRLVSHPEYSDTDCPISIESFNGCLTVVCSDYGTNFSVWVMKEYGVKESWTKIVSVTDSLSNGVMTSYPLAYNSNDCGEILVCDRCTNTFFWFSLAGNKVVKMVNIAGINYMRDLATCLGSLVPIK